MNNSLTERLIHRSPVASLATAASPALLAQRGNPSTDVSVQDQRSPVSTLATQAEEERMRYHGSKELNVLID